jgi:hypothetical protein
MCGWGVLVQGVGDESARVHFDIHTDNLDAEVLRLVALGAQVLSRDQSWVVLRDPCGVVFCVVPVESDDSSLDGANEWS